MEINYFDLSGGINQASTKTELGANTKKIYWSDSENIEVYNNKGIIKQKGNTLFIELPESEEITAMHEMDADGISKLVIVTVSGKIYIYSDSSNELTLIEKTLTGKRVCFAPFLRGIIVATETDKMFYINNNETYKVEECNLQDKTGNIIYPDCIAIYRGRVWCSKDSTIYYSALGTYNDFKTEEDAGYISDFFTDTADITGMQNYKDYLAIYKKEKVFLLSGSSPSDFALTPFADKGTMAGKSIVNVDNKQYFLSNGIFALEQVGELNQIRLGSEISKNIKDEFQKFNSVKLYDTVALHYKDKNQTWFLFPYVNDDYYHVIWINDYVNHSWYKRVLPQNITCAANFKSYIITADADGRIYYENYGTTFNGKNIKFMWKSPFLSLGIFHHRKMIEEFYFVLDDLHDNNFNFSIYKDYDSGVSDNMECVMSRCFNQLIWASENTEETSDYCWTNENESTPVWSIGTDVLQKAEIFGSCYSVQLCLEGNEPQNNCAIIGLQFREIYIDD